MKENYKIGFFWEFLFNKGQRGNVRKIILRDDKLWGLGSRVVIRRCRRSFEVIQGEGFFGGECCLMMIWVRDGGVEDVAEAGSGVQLCVDGDVVDRLQRFFQIVYIFFFFYEWIFLILIVLLGSFIGIVCGWESFLFVFVVGVDRCLELW